MNTTSSRLLAVLSAMLLLITPLGDLTADASKIRPGLQSVDSSPLAERIPLILVHGIRPNPEKAYGWDGFLQHAAKNPDFSSHYKPYLFVYQPALPLQENSKRFREAFSGYRTQAEHAQLMNPKGSAASLPPFRIIALSSGGLVIRAAMQNKAIDA